MMKPDAPLAWSHLSSRSPVRAPRREWRVVLGLLLLCAIPVGAEVTFTVTSPVVIHGFLIAGTRVTLMLIPGQVSRLTYTFRRPGEYAIICHEYCGLGHQGMVGRVIVE